MFPRYWSGLRQPSPSSAFPKAILFFLTITALYHIPYLVRSLQHATSQLHRTSASLSGDHFGGQESNHQIEGAGIKPGPHHNIDHTAFNYNNTFLSYGPQNCFPSFNATLQDFAATRNISCLNSTPFPLADTYRTAFATASTGGALNLAYEHAILSQMTHSVIHNSTMHMLCAELTPGIWNKIAFLLHLVTLELLKPPSDRLDWILWADRDALLLDQCRPLSSFLPPKTPEYDPIHLITNHDALGLNAGVFFFRPTHWIHHFFTVVLAYPHYRPDEPLVFAEQSAMQLLIASVPDVASHTVRVPWYWFNAYPPDDGSTAHFVNGTSYEGQEWFRARRGDFIVHFAGHLGRETEMVRWSEALEQVGDVWAGVGREWTRDVSADVGRYWGAWKDGVVTERMQSGEP